MSLLRLAPESQRLRRIARAYAAGEFSRREYRAARRETLQQLVEGFSYDPESTERRADITARGAVASNDVVLLQPTVARPWLPVLLVLAALLLVTAAALANAAELPSAAERDPNPYTAPRFAVQQLTLANAEDLDGLPIAELEALAAAALEEARQQDRVGPHGFSSSELEEIGRLLAASGVHEASTVRLGARDAADLAALIQSQKERRGVSAHTLQRVADQVAAHVRERYGYLLAQAHLPAQRVDQGQVRFRLELGVLESVAVQGRSAPAVQREFVDLLGTPLTRDALETRIYALNALPGFSSEASFSPGNSYGTTQLDVRVTQDDPLALNVQLDNYGDEVFGRYRLAAQAAWNSPRGIGDVLTIGLAQAAEPQGQTFFNVGYSQPVGTTRSRILGQYSRNNFSRDASGAVEGTGDLFSLAWRQTVSHNRTEHASLQFQLGHQRLTYEDLDESFTGEDQNVTFLGAAWQRQRIWDGPAIETRGTLDLRAGRINGALFAGQEREFWRLRLDALAWKPLAVPFSARDLKLVVRLRGQASDSRLPGPQRLALGGGDLLRGFERGATLLDSGALLALETRAPLPLGEAYVFLESAYGETHSELNDTFAHLTSAGFGWDVDWQQWRSRLSFGVPLSSKQTGGLDDEGPRLFWSLQYSH